MDIYFGSCEGYINDGERKAHFQIPSFKFGFCISQFLASICIHTFFQTNYAIYTHICFNIIYSISYLIHVYIQIDKIKILTWDL